MDKAEEYEQDKMLLANMKRELHEDASQTLETDKQIESAVAYSEKHVGMV